MSAFMWHVAQRHHVMQYDKLAEFISLVTEIVPELLSCGQRAQLVMGLRARLVLELCRDDGLANLQTIQSHLDKIHACTADLSSSHQQTSMEVLKTSYTNFANLVQKLLNVPFEKEYFFQEVFPTNYGSAYDQTLQQLVSEFLSRLEQLLPAPDYTQTAAWLTETTAVAEEFGQHLSEPFALKTLLLYHRQLGTLSTGPSCSQEDVILSTLALPPEFDVEKFSVLYSGDEDYEEEGLAMLDSEDKDSSQSSDTGSEDLLPTKKSGPLAKLFICPQCSFAHQVKRKVQEHIQREHQMRITLDGKESAKKGRKRAEQKKKDLIIKNKKVHKQKSDSQRKWEHKRKDTLENKRERKRKKEDNSENKKERCNQRELSADDRRFLSTRAVNKNFTEEETKCPKCDKVFELPNQLKTHLKLHTLPYHCSQCEKGFTSKSGYYQHQRVHKKGRTFVCSHCNKGFLCTYSLKQHELMHTEGPSHLCTVCGKRFSKLGIVRHMRMHKGEKNYLCTTCGKSFLSSGELLLHTRSHTRETPYTCTHCGKGFTNTSHLNVHVRSHTGERPYLCSQCPKRFITLNCLKRHMLCHDGVKPYKCSNCGKEFTQQGNLKRHLTTHQPDT
ncbi:zinc finger protein 260-like isoform X2 [Myripristis murdjan]|nr:zinc finger protein 260-like isoform X2 [Myripristis murdjan]XP_029901967.1 zinc finger protein 260-like isoform X2 [Myripristis murdjan]